MHEETTFGDRLRNRRLSLAANDRGFSLRQLAARVGVEPSYLSKIERGEQPPPGEETIRKIARELGEDADVFLALGGKVSSDLLEIIRQRPEIVAELLRAVRELPDRKVKEIARDVRDGEW